MKNKIRKWIVNLCNLLSVWSLLPVQLCSYFSMISADIFLQLLLNLKKMNEDFFWFWTHSVYYIQGLSIQCSPPCLPNNITGEPNQFPVTNSDEFILTCLLWWIVVQFNVADKSHNLLSRLKGLWDFLQQSGCVAKLEET